MASIFKIDTLIKTFKDLQQEKSCLEQKLRELREKRKRVEAEDEAAATRLMQVEFKLFSSKITCASLIHCNR